MRRKSAKYQANLRARRADAGVCVGCGGGFGGRDNGGAVPYRCHQCAVKNRAKGKVHYVHDMGAACGTNGDAVGSRKLSEVTCGNCSRYLNSLGITGDRKWP